MSFLRKQETTRVFATIVILEHSEGAATEGSIQGAAESAVHLYVIPAKAGIYPGIRHRRMQGHRRGRGKEASPPITIPTKVGIQKWKGGSMF